MIPRVAVWSVALMLPALTVVRAADRQPPRVADAFTPTVPGAVRVAGELGAAIDLGIRARVAAQSVDDLVAPFQLRRDKTEWRSEFWGKWATSAVAAWRYSGDDALGAHVRAADDGLLATQTAEGYIGAYPDGGHLQRWDIWGRKYTLLGLLAWHDATGDERALAAARREADFLLQEVGPGKASPFTNDMWNGMASSSVLEPMVLLYRRTGDDRYLEFARYLVREWPSPAGPDLLRKAEAGVPVAQMFPGAAPVVKKYGDAGHAKAYEMMSCFEGLAELYRTTGEAEYRAALEKIFANIRDSEITIIGSGSDWERWNSGRTHQTEPWVKGMETCVTVTWMKLAAQLLRLTGDPRYADEIERTTYNALLGAQAVDGTWWCHHSPLAGTKERAPEQCDMHQNCCVANGPRGLLLVPQLAVMLAPDGVVINELGPLHATVPLPGGQTVTFEQASEYPLGDSVHLKLRLAAPTRFTLRLRVPAWSEHTALAINARAEPAPAAGKYATLAREWRNGDTVALTLDLRTRVETAPGHPEFVAFQRGPLVLARDARLSGGAALDAPLAPAFNAAGNVSARLSPKTERPLWAIFDLDIAGLAGPERLCAFASAGNTWGADSAYRVWLPRGAPAR